MRKKKKEGGQRRHECGGVGNQKAKEKWLLLRRLRRMILLR